MPAPPRAGLAGAPWRSSAGWLIAAAATSLVVAIPVLVVLSSVFGDSDGAWAHLAATRLGDYVANTLLLALGTVTVAAVAGIPTAWLVTMHDFPGRRLLAWGLLLPLAVPAYLSAYALTDLLQFSGTFRTGLRGTPVLAGLDPWIPDLRTLPGAIAIVGFSLAPYVYLAARAAFLEQSRALLEASRTLGRGPLATVLRVALPMARPTLVAALLLVVMETVAEFGAVQHCAVDTFATGIHRTWIGLDAPVAAAQLASLVLGLVFLVVLADGWNRRHARFHHVSVRDRGHGRTRLRGGPAALATTACLVPFGLGFALPAGRLVALALGPTETGGAVAAAGLGRLVDPAVNTFLLGAIAAIVATVLSVVVVYAARVGAGDGGGRIARGLVDVCRAGYAVPGPVVAIGLLAALGWIDHRLNDASRALLPDQAPPGLLLTGSIVAVLVAYQTRFLAVAIAMVHGGFGRLHRRLDEAARTLGSRPLGTLLRVHLPAMPTTLLVAGLLVFVDVIKELPATLMLRPFDFDTLAVRTYQFASDERLAEAAPAALAIIAVGLVPLALLHARIERPMPAPAPTGPVAPSRFPRCSVPTPPATEPPT